MGVKHENDISWHKQKRKSQEKKEGKDLLEGILVNVEKSLIFIGSGCLHEEEDGGRNLLFWFDYNNVGSPSRRGGVFNHGFARTVSY